MIRNETFLACFWGFESFARTQTPPDSVQIDRQVSPSLCHTPVRRALGSDCQIHIADTAWLLKLARSPSELFQLSLKDNLSTCLQIRCKIPSEDSRMATAGFEVETALPPELWIRVLSGLNFAER